MATSGLFLPSGRRCGPTASSWWFRSATAAARSTLASWAACSPLLDGSTTWGVLAWLLVGVGLVFFGVIWLLGETETIVLPVVTGTIVAAVAGPVVSALARHRAHELPAQRSSCSAC